MDHPDYQKHLVSALQQQRDQATNNTAHLAALIQVRDSEIEMLKKQIEELKPKAMEVAE